MQFDDYGRRIFRRQDRAFKYQETVSRYPYGVWSGVIRNGLGWSLLYDPQTET